MLISVGTVIVSQSSCISKHQVVQPYIYTIFICQFYFIKYEQKLCCNKWHFHEVDSK